MTFIASAAGIPDKLHPEIIACTNFEVAKVCVTADLSKQLPRRMKFTIQRVETMVEFTYPWLPSKCSTCGKWGHSEKVCSVTDKEEKKETSELSETEVRKEGLEEVTLGKKSMMEDEQVVDTKVREEEITEPWRKVSPEKIGRSPMKNSQKMQLENERIITPSRFAALSIPEEDEQV